MTGQLSLDDCQPDWPVADPPPRHPSAGTHYRLRMQNDLWGQRLHIRSTSRIVTIPIAGEYL